MPATAHTSTHSSASTTQEANTSTLREDERPLGERLIRYFGKNDSFPIQSDNPLKLQHNRVRNFLADLAYGIYTKQSKDQVAKLREQATNYEELLSLNPTMLRANSRQHSSPSPVATSTATEEINDTCQKGPLSPYDRFFNYFLLSGEIEVIRLATRLMFHFGRLATQGIGAFGRFFASSTVFSLVMYGLAGTLVAFIQGWTACKDQADISQKPALAAATGVVNGIMCCTIQTALMALGGMVLPVFGVGLGFAASVMLNSKLMCEVEGTINSTYNAIATHYPSYYGKNATARKEAAQEEVSFPSKIAQTVWAERQPVKRLIHWVESIASSKNPSSLENNATAAKPKSSCCSHAV